MTTTPPPSFDPHQAWEGNQANLWNQAAERLVNSDSAGIATITLPDKISTIVAQSWNVIAKSLHEIEKDPDLVLKLNNTADSAHCTGYHHAGIDEERLQHSSSSLTNRYNTYRRGFIMSDGAWTCPMQVENDSNQELDTALLDLFHILHTILEQVLLSLACHWELPDKEWFQTALGPTRDSSQWHVKEFQSPVCSLDNHGEEQEWLPTHTDPSLISVVIHDRTSLAGSASGLQYHKDQNWHNVETMTTTSNKFDETSPVEAVIFVGSILSTLTGGQVPACKHRVVYRNGGTPSPRRAVTLFGRPAPTARMQIVPSPAFANVHFRQEGMLFRDWLARVARNYEKSKKRSNKK